MATVTRLLRSADELATSTFDRAFEAAHNPWRHLGALAFACLLLVVSSALVPERIVRRRRAGVRS